jgi:hypothetical protein
MKRAVDVNDHSAVLLLHDDVAGGRRRITDDAGHLTMTVYTVRAPFAGSL